MDTSQVVKYFTAITVYQCDPMEKDNDGKQHHITLCLVLMVTLNIAQYLIRVEHCNPSCENNDGKTPLHYACANWLPQHCPCTSSERNTVIHHVMNNDGWTPLHAAL